jgi:ceramide glucosyltransferase
MTWLAILLTVLYLLDRAWKTAAIWRFFRRQPPPEPAAWSSVSLIQPITASPNDLRAALTLRAQRPYPGALEQILVCDPPDAASQALCRELMQEFPHWRPKLVLAQSPNGVALKTVKQLAGLEAATGDIVCFIDDDILLRPDTLPTLVRHLQPGIGATFGLACYTNWRTPWGGLMSAFVNANALLNYVPLTYLVEPRTVTGHLYALRRADFDAIGGLDGMSARLDDDHELARRVNRAGLRNCQTPALYNVDNELPSLRAFLAQMKRWFVFPRELMLPGFPPRERALTLASSLPSLLPGLVGLLVVGGAPVWTLAACLTGFYAVYFWGERRILQVPAPAWGWSLLLLVVLVLPFQILFLLFSDNAILWRGKRYRVKRSGEYDLLD